MPTDLIRAHLPFDQSAPRAARDLLRVAILEDGASFEDAILGASELVTNAVMHGSGPVTFRVTTADGIVRIEVCDSSRRPPVIPNEASRRPGGGRGLAIVARVSDDWGWFARAPGKCVWATFDLGRR